MIRIDSHVNLLDSPINAIYISVLLGGYFIIFYYILDFVSVLSYSIMPFTMDQDIHKINKNSRSFNTIS